MTRVNDDDMMTRFKVRHYLKQSSSKLFGMPIYLIICFKGFEDLPYSKGTLPFISSYLLLWSREGRFLKVVPSQSPAKFRKYEGSSAMCTTTTTTTDREKGPLSL